MARRFDVLPSHPVHQQKRISTRLRDHARPRMAQTVEGMAVIESEPGFQPREDFAQPVTLIDRVLASDLIWKQPAILGLRQHLVNHFRRSQRHGCVPSTGVGFVREPEVAQLTVSAYPASTQRDDAFPPGSGFHGKHREPIEPDILLPTGGENRLDLLRPKCCRAPSSSSSTVRFSLISARGK